MITCLNFQPRNLYVNQKPWLHFLCTALSLGICSCPSIHIWQTWRYSKYCDWRIIY